MIVARSAYTVGKASTRMFRSREGEEGERGADGERKKRMCLNKTHSRICEGAAQSAQSWRRVLHWCTC